MKKVLPAAPAELDTLRSVEAQAVLTLLHKNGWLSADVPAVKSFFAAEPQHPAKDTLMAAAACGGAAGYLQMAVLLGFAAMALVLTSFQPEMNPMLFALWGAIGVSLALTLRKHPGFLGVLNPKKK